MRTRLKLTAAVVAVSMTIGSLSPASAAVVGGGAGGGTSGGGISAGTRFFGVCLFGSAFGLIWAALAKGRAYNSSTIELTQQEAFGIAGTCGLAAGPVSWNWRRN